MVAFGDVVAAVACALAVQRAVLQDNQEHPRQELQVRIGLNCGQAIKEEEDFFGSAVVVAARLADLARGGEIFVSATVRGLMGLEPGIRYVRRGRHHLKGLDGTYDIWAVPWREGGARRFATLPASPALLVALPMVLLVLIGGGTMTGLFLSGALGGGGTSAGVAYRDLATHMEILGSSVAITGDCKTSDLFVTGTFTGRVTGDITGGAKGSSEGTAYVADKCLRTRAKGIVTLTDNGGSTLSLIGVSLSVHRIGGLSNVTGSSSQVDRAASVITGGTGKYAGVTGKGTCATLAFISENSPGSASSTAQATSDCTLQIAQAADAEPVIMQAATSVDEMTVVGHSTNLPYEAMVAVIYRNDRNQPQTGLSLRVPVPEGAQLKMISSGEAPTASLGERTWGLPDLPAGAEAQFEFVVQVLSATGRSVSLVPEIDGEGLGGPARSSAVTINVVQ